MKPQDILRWDAVRERERLQRLGLDPLDLAESERAHQLDLQERSDDHSPVSALFRVGTPFLTCSIYRGDIS